MIAIIPASAIAVAGSSPATSSGAIAAKISGDTDESGPSTSTRDGPEERVADEAGDRRVEPGDRRQAGQLGVGHALRDQDRGQHDAGDEVGAQPRVAGTPRTDAGRPAPSAAKPFDRSAGTDGDRSTCSGRQPRTMPSAAPDGVGSGRRIMRNELSSPRSAGEDRDEQRDLQREGPGVGVDADDLVLDRLGLADEQLLELGVAHHLGVVLERVGDLLLLGRREHGARSRPCW